MIKRLSLIILLIGLSSVAYGDLYLTAKFGTYAFDVENTSKASVSGTGAYALDIGYDVGYNLILSAIFNVLLASTISGDQGFGFDLALKHYPISTSGFSKISEKNIELSVADLYRPYYGVAFRQREFLLVLATNYVGPSFFFGLDYQWKEDWYINSEFRYDLLSGSGEATAVQTNILFGLGRSF